MPTCRAHWEFVLILVLEGPPLPKDTLLTVSPSCCTVTLSYLLLSSRPALLAQDSAGLGLGDLGISLGVFTAMFSDCHSLETLRVMG